MEDDVKTLGDYVRILRRRKALLIWPMLVLMLIAVIYAVTVPAVYQSSATILIEQQDIPQDLVRSTITTYADQRLQVISQRVMTSANLTRIIKKFNLYGRMREKNSITTILEKLRKDISMEMISADVIDPRSGRPTEATIAFTLSYESGSPELAQKVASELVSLYLNENIKTRTEKTEETSIFLQLEAGKLKDQIIEIEDKLAAFKEKNAGSLPELMQLNIQLMERAEREMNEIDGRIRALIERKGYLEAELSQIHPDVAMFTKSGERIMGPEDRLKLLKAEYAQMVASYSTEHPDLVRTRQEIASLEKTVGGNTAVSELKEKLKQQRGELGELRKKYSDEHPSVKKLEISISSLQATIKRESVKPLRKIAPTTKPDNPAYIQLAAQLNAVNTELDSFTKQKDSIKNKMNDLERRLIESPQVERAYLNLTRDYDNANLRYQEIKAKQNSAHLGEQLEKGQQGERLSLIEPPLMPEKPIKPNRMAILFLGFIFSIGGGIGAVTIAESMSQTIHGTASVTKLLTVPPLAIIPYAETKQTTRHRKSKRIIVAIVILTGLFGVVWLVNLFVMPLDVLWFSGLRKVGL